MEFININTAIYKLKSELYTSSNGAIWGLHQVLTLYPGPFPPIPPTRKSLGTRLTGSGNEGVSHPPHRARWLPAGRALPAHCRPWTMQCVLPYLGRQEVHRTRPASQWCPSASRTPPQVSWAGSLGNQRQCSSFAVEYSDPMRAGKTLNYCTNLLPDPTNSTGVTSSPGCSHLRYLIACSIQVHRWGVWEIWSGLPPS